jgi:FtsZ-binding cell division protein ZapB
MDDLPVFVDGRSQSLEPVINGLLENGISMLPNRDITGSILYLYKRLQQKITSEQLQGSIAESDMSLSNNESIQSNTIGSSMGVCKENVREQIVSAPYARIGVSKERHDELKETFEAFRVEYRKSNGSVMGLDKEFENLKKRHPKTWHEVVPTLLDKLKDQNEQRKAQREEQKFTPELPMLSRYVKEQMWDRHYYTSTKQSEPKKTIANFTPDQLT